MRLLLKSSIIKSLICSSRMKPLSRLYYGYKHRQHERMVNAKSHKISVIISHSRAWTFRGCFSIAITGDRPSFYPHPDVLNHQGIVSRMQKSFQHNGVALRRKLSNANDDFSEPQPVITTSFSLED
jgi:hypothetical protein